MIHRNLASHLRKQSLRCAGIAAVALGVSSIPLQLKATVFNWAGTTWTQGAPAAGASKNQSFNSIRPNFINVQIDNNTPGSPTGGTWNAGYPVVDNTTTNGGVTGQNALQLYLTKQASTTSFVQVTVKFGDLVNATSFTLYDVDLTAGTWKDTISNIQAKDISGLTIGVTSVATGTTNTSTGSGLSTVVTGTANNNPSTLAGGNVTFTFSQPITQFSFDWSNTDPGLSTQLIGLGNINFTLVPEIAPGWVTLGVCGLIAGTGLAKRRRRKNLVLT